MKMNNWSYAEQRGGVELRYKGYILRNEILTALQDAVRATSLRGTARAVGMSATGLAKLIKNGRAYRPTQRRLEKWFLQQEPPTPEGRDSRLDLAIEVVVEAGGTITWPSNVEREVTIEQVSS
jgi:hypothetical protein